MRIVEWRHFPGPNVHCHRPVMELLLDLEELSGTNSRDLPGFVEGVLNLVPGIAGHYCGLGFPGGFLVRLREGTYLGHVTEHVALELLECHGHPVVYGKTRAVDDARYLVVFEAPLAELGLEAALAAVRIVEALADDPQRDMSSEVERFRRLASALALGPSTSAIVRAAQRRGIPVRRIGTGSLVHLGWGRYGRRVEATLASLSSAVAVDVASDKHLTKTILRIAGIPVPRGGLAHDRVEAIALAATLAPPLVVKPLFGNQGKGVTTGVRKRRDLVQAVRAASAYGRPVVVEEEVPGKQYRFLVVGDQVVAVAERQAPAVVGDGLRTVRDLVAAENEDPRRGEGHEKPLTKIRLDAACLRHLARQGLTPEAVPAAGQRVTLRDGANLSTGGVATDVTEDVSPALRSLAVRAARAVGLDIAGVDIMARDPAEEHGVVLEVNACPGIRMHEHPWRGTPRPVGEAIVRHLFPVGDGRIPIVAVTGTNGKSTTVRLIAHILAKTGRVVGMTTTDGVYVGGERIVRGDCAGPRSAEAVLFDPRVEAAVLECARGGLRRGGLPYDQADVGVFLNLTGDHLGQDGIETLEDLLHVKSLVVEAVRPDGFAVLNADDPFVLSVRNACRCGVILFSQRQGNLAVKKWLQTGGTAVYVRQEAIWLARGDAEERVVRVGHLPFALGGAADCMVENALAAAAAAAGLGLPSQAIAEGLSSFAGDAQQNPGRLNLYRVGGVTVLVDYGHNPAALQAVLRATRRLDVRRCIGVIGMPGDRRDEDAVAFGVIAGRGFHRVLIKEDRDRRGRKPREMAELIARGVRSTGLAAVEIEPDEATAFARALGEAEEGDLVVVFYEKVEPILEVLERYRARTERAVAPAGLS